MKNLEQKTIEWGAKRGFYLKSGGTNHALQFTKLIEYAGQLANNISNNEPPNENIGQMVAILASMAHLSESNLTECWQLAYDKFKDTTGIMQNGVFKKNIN